MNGIDKCTLKDSGLNLKDSVCIVFKNKKISMIFVNQTNKRYKLPEVYMVVRVTALNEKKFPSIKPNKTHKKGLMYKKSNTIQRHVRKSNDLLAKKDCELGVLIMSE